MGELPLCSGMSRLGPAESHAVGFSEDRVNPAVPPPPPPHVHVHYVLLRATAVCFLEQPAQPRGLEVGVNRPPVDMKNAQGVHILHCRM